MALRNATVALCTGTLIFATLGCDGCGSYRETAYLQSVRHASQRSSERATRGTRVPADGIVAHEWAVFRRQHGLVNHLEELAGECPPFVVRMERAPPPSELIADKPVLFLYGNVASVRVEVTFVNGTPWLAYPPPENPTGAADVLPLDREARPLPVGRLVWQGSVGPPVGPLLSAGGFWWTLRDVGASTFTTGAGASEQFIYYDGPVAIEFPLQFTSARAHVTTADPSGFFSREVWVVRRDGADRMRWAGTHGENAYLQTWHPHHATDRAALQAELRTTLIAHGLSEEEAESLLVVWRHDLFEYEGSQLVYVLPDATYQAALPLVIEPTPRELRRVALVIDRG